MKRLAVAALSAASLAGVSFPALAADLPVQEPAPAYQEPVPAARFDWTGFYAGADLGWGWAGFTDKSSSFGKSSPDANGVNGGVHAGYNYQIAPNFVAGLEADFQLSDLDKTRSVGGYSVHNSSDWNSSLRGRLGYTFDRFMVYGTGGFAMADSTVKLNGDKDDTTALGYTLGAGVEGAVTDHVTARLEYVYQDFGRDKFHVDGTTVKTDLDNNVVRAGVSYKF